MIKVELIKRFLDEGFTLTKAVEKQRKNKTAHHIRKVFTGALQNLEVINDRFTIISLGPIKDSNQLLHIIHDDESNQLDYELLPENQPLDIDKYRNL